MSDKTTSQRLRDLEAAGIIEPARPGARPLPPPVPIEPFGIGQTMLQKDRDERFESLLPKAIEPPVIE